MTNPEFSSEFDILFNSIMSNQAPGLSEYEKSVFLTQAQEEVVVAAYTGSLSGDPFEASEQVRSYIQNLLKTARTTTKLADPDLVDDQSVVFLVPEDVWFPIYEQVIFDDDGVKCNKGQRIKVKPITHDVLDKIRGNPFKGANDKRVLRLSLDSGKVELISKYNVGEYLVRYQRRPTPIILEDLDQYGLSINGVSDETECELNNSIHRIILNRAVDLAKASWS